MDMRVFWKDLFEDNKYDLQGTVHLNDVRKYLGMFFWERGGKDFAVYQYESCGDLESMIKEAKGIIEDTMNSLDYDGGSILGSRDFLDALACLGEEKIKELVGGLK